MKKNIFFSLSIAVVISMLVFAACDDTDSLAQDPVEGVSDNETALTVDNTELPPLGNSDRIISFYSSEKWTIKDVPSWIDVTPTSGKAGNTNITIKMHSLGAIDDYKDNLRAATLRFVSAVTGQTLQTFDVSQQRPYLHLSTIETKTDTKDSLRAAYAIEALDSGLDHIYKWSDYGSASPYQIEVTSNVDWEYILNAESDYIISRDTVKLDGSDRYMRKIIFSIIPKIHNVDKVPYFADLRFNALDGNNNTLDNTKVDYIHRDWKFEHKNLRFLINDSPDDITLDMGELIGKYNSFDQGKPLQSVYLSTEIDWSKLNYSNGASEWMSYTPVVKDSLLTFSIEKINKTGADREAAVTVSAVVDGALVSRTIRFTQKPYTFRAQHNSSTTAIGNNDLSYRHITVTTNGPWTYSTPDSWTESYVSGTVLSSDSEYQFVGNGTIYYKAVGQNLAFSDYNGQVVVEGLQDVSDTRAISQDKFVFDVEPDPGLMNVSTLGNSPLYTVSINCSGNWTIDNAGNYPWIKFDTTSGSTNLKSFSINVPDVNPNFESDRDAQLTIVSLNHKAKGQDVTRKISVKQLKYIWGIASGSTTSGISYNPRAYDKKYDAGSGGVDYPLTIKCSGTWSITDAPSWFVPSKTSGSAVETGQTIFFSPKGNTASTSRSATIHIKDSYSHETLAVNVVQDGFVFQVTSAQLFENIPELTRNMPTYAISVKHTADSPLSLTVPESWINYSTSTQVSGREQTTTYTLAISNNAALSERQQTLSLKSSFSTSNTASFVFKQEAYKFDSTPVTISSYKELAGNAGTKSYVDIVCSGDWVTANVPDWITLSETYASQGKTISVSPKNNVNTSSRSATFTIMSSLNGLTKLVSVSQDAYKFDASSETFSYGALEQRTDNVDVLCSGKWSVKNVPSWLTSSHTGGTGSQDGITTAVSLTSRNNFTESDLSGKITIVSDDNPNLVKEVNVAQSKYRFVPGLTSNNYGPIDDSSVSLPLSAIGDWRIESDADWVAFSPASGSGDATINISHSYNLNTTDRVARVSLIPVYNGGDISALKKTYTINQTKFLLGIDKTSHSFSSPMADENTAAVVNVTCSSDWTVNEPEGYTVTKNTSSFTVAPKNNFLKSSINGVVTVSSVLGGHSVAYNVSQPAYVFDETPAPVSVTACPANNLYLDVICSGNWTYSVDDPSWFTSVSQSVSRGNGQIVINPMDNPDQHARSAVVTATSLDNPSYKKVFTLTQAAHIFELSAVSMAFGPAPDASQSFAITTSGPWTVVSDQNWVSVSPASGNGNGSVTISASANPLKSDRNATVTVKCTSTGLSKTVSITQEAYEFDETPVALTDIASCDAATISVPVTCSGAWSYSVSDASFFKSISQTAIKGNGYLSLTVADNPGSSARSATITVSSSDNTSFKKVVTLTQLGHEMSLSTSSLSFDAVPVAQTVTLNTVGPWTASFPQDKVVVSPSSGNGTTLVSVRAKVNTTGASDNFSVVFACTTNSSVNASLAVTRAPYIFSVPAASQLLIFDYNEVGAPQAVPVTCSGAWNVSSCPDWISTIKDSAVLYIHPKSNNTSTEEDRTGYVIIASADEPSLTFSIEVRQRKSPTE